MTSQQLTAKLDEAVKIIGECERFFQSPSAPSNSWALMFLEGRTRDFMEAHRQSLTEGGAS